MSSNSALRLSERTDFRELLSHPENVALWTATEPGRFDYLSPGFEDPWGIPVSDAREALSVLLDRVHPEDRDRVLALFEGSAEDVAPERLEHRVVHPDGTVRWVDARLFPIHGDSGEITAVVGATVDVTEQKRRERELEVLNRILRHDIRNDMAVILGWLGELEGPVTDEDDAILDRVRTASQHVLELTEIAREHVDVIVSGGEFDLSPVDVPRTVEAELSARRQTYPDATFEVEGSLPDVAVEANELLRSVVRNLLNNAVQHNDRPTPHVTVSVEATEGTVGIEVADDEPGIPARQRESIFGAGEKGLESSGTGMGLYLCHEIVRAYGGEIRYDPNEPEGSVFRVELPRAN